jgi:small conductance mechanosensitive channel
MAWKDKIISYLIDNGPKLLGAVVIIFVGVLIARWLGRILLRWLQGKEMEPPVRMLITRITKLLVIGLMAIIALGTLGFNIMALVTGIGVAGVGISLALQGVLGNLVAGLLIIFTKPFRVGEYIELIGVHGQVDAIELFNTTLQHVDRSKVVIPNRKIVGEILHNYGTIRQLDLVVGVAYHSNLPETVRVVREVLAANPRVLKDLTPVVGVSTLADSSIQIAVKPWVAIGDYVPAQAEIYEALVARFREMNIQIPFPQREVRVLNETPPRGVAAN